MEQVILSVNDKGYAHIVLNRPEKMNAITQKMITELHDALKQARTIENLKCLVISGAGGRAFCAGGDLQEFHGGLTKEEAYQILSPMKDVLYELAYFPVPTLQQLVTFAMDWLMVLMGLSRGSLEYCQDGAVVYCCIKRSQHISRLTG
ncbi:enoyl-CoA hydratase/isomerase family protein [Halobacillus shinanisalinarum]|uniref:enoyl-CoA hydratase/isomerase family protein n=1 Tax=Halobacillus shinanisalinarum TaxID=2932258 RepID=UPI002106ADDF|nr:enoyl-CoA hydratase/isomerase family protein [Halobacillus shinanisalinarum]